MADILDARAWEDYLDVDGSRKSCPSFAEWLDRNGVDIKLAEFAIREKKTEYLVKFYEARDGMLKTVSEGNLGKGGSIETIRARAKERSIALQSGAATTSTPSARGGSNAYWLLRLSRDSSSDPRAAELLALIESKNLGIQKAAELMGWKRSSQVNACHTAIKAFCPQAKSYAQKVGIAPEELIKRALEEFIENHPDPQDL
jgi:hypothetical protein